MEYISTTLQNLVHQTAFMNLTGGNLVMIGVACFFLYLAIRHEFESAWRKGDIATIGWRAAMSPDCWKI